MSLNRRDFIYGMGASLGSVALAGMMSAQANAAKSAPGPLALKKPHRSEEHTSELQSRRNLVCRLLLEKKKKHTHV